MPRRIILFLLPFLSAAMLQASGRIEGVSTAPLRVEVFSDFQCPACKALHDTILKSVITDYVKTGKASLVHHEYPLPMHQYSRLAAMYALAAAKLNKYDAVADALFAQQSSWAVNGKLEEAVAKALSAAEMQKVKALAKDPATAAEVDRDIAQARQLGVTRTPTVYVTSKGRQYPIPPGTSYPILKRFFDELLSQQ